MNKASEKLTWARYAITWALSVTPFFLLYGYLRHNPDDLVERLIPREAMVHMSERNKAKLYRVLAERSPCLWDITPEPLVGHLLQKNVKKMDANAEVVSNNVGMRSSRPYVRKSENGGKYRIVCLGDSFVYGLGVKEEDRFGDQIEQILHDFGVTVDGKEIEVYSVGLSGWTAVNEATYLSSRISEYDPDLVLGLMCANDLDDNYCISGLGALTWQFAPENHQYGSGVIRSINTIPFKVPFFNLLHSDLGPESRTRWRKAFGAWKRLETLLGKRNAKMICAVLRFDQDPLFVEMCKYFHQETGMTCPIIITDYFENQLLHESHPDSVGHRILALHYLHTLADLGWLPINRSDLPPLDARLSVASKQHPDIEKIHFLKNEKIAKILDKSIVFNNLRGENAMAFLGGFVIGDAKDPLTHYPYGTLKSVFLLRRKKGARKLLLEIEVPPRCELYPFKLEMRLNGDTVTELMLDDEENAGRHLLQGVIPQTDEFESTIEVTLLTESYWAEIDIPTMLSYQFVRVWQE